MTPAPTLTTKRLTLRGPQAQDLDPFTDLVVNSPRMKALDEAGTASDAWRGFVAGIGHWQMLGYGFFTIVETATGTPVGRCGILGHVGWPEPELAYHMFDNGEARGMAFEAAVAVRHWAGETLGFSPLVSIIHPDNTRSRSLAERLGAVVEKTGEHDGHPAVFYRHLRHHDPAALAMRVSA